MPRDHNQLDVDTESSIRSDEIPDLTMSNAAELITDCDYVIISIRELLPKRFYKSEWIDTQEKASSNANEELRFNRSKTIFYEFLNTFNDLTPDDEPSSVTTAGMRHYKIIPKNSETFNDIQRFITDMVPLWRFVSVSLCWSNHQHPKASTIIYENEDNMPPHPATEAFKLQTEYREKTDEEQNALRSQKEAAHIEYEEENTDPRFTFGAKYIINGDYGAGGADIHMYTSRNMYTDVLFDIESYTDTLLFPSRYDDVDTISDYERVTVDYPKHMTITEITDRDETVKEENTPQPVLTPVPTEHNTR